MIDIGRSDIAIWTYIVYTSLEFYKIRFYVVFRDRKLLY